MVRVVEEGLRSRLPCDLARRRKTTRGKREERGLRTQSQRRRTYYTICESFPRGRFMFGWSFGVGRVTVWIGITIFLLKIMFNMLTVGFDSKSQFGSLNYETKR